MMGWTCCCIAWLKELRRKMRESAERQGTIGAVTTHEIPVFNVPEKGKLSL